MLKRTISLLLAALLAMTLGFTSLAAEEIIITVHDDACTKDSDWVESTSEEVKGPTGENSFYGNHPIAYSAEDVPAGTYDLYVYNLPVYSTPDAVSVKVVHKEGTEEVELDYTAHPKGWLAIGTYAFSGSSDETVTFSIMPKSAGRIQRSAAIKFTPNDSGKTVSAGTVVADTTTASEDLGEPRVVPEGGEIIMGCDNPGFSRSSNWVDSSLDMPSGEMSWYSFSVGATATWTPNLAKQDNITVYYLKAAAAANEDTAAFFEIYAEGKTTEVVIDVTSGDVGWTELGTFNFAGDNSEYIKLTKQTSDTCTRATDLRFAVKTEEEVQADNSVLKGTDKEILERLGMLIGEGDGVTAEYIKTVPTRVQAAVLVLRLRGLEEEAKAYTSEDNFADGTEAEWSENILAYIKAHPEYGMIGVGDNLFDPKAEINAQQYTKILLEALGYRYNTDFTWDETFAKAEEVGLTINKSGQFTVEALAEATVSALGLPVKDSKITLLGSVVAQRDGIRDEEYLVNPQALPEELKAAHLETRHKARGLIYNDDGNDTYVGYPEYPGDFNIATVTEPMTHENFLSKRTNGVEDSQVTTIMYCDGVFNSYHHRSSGETTVRKRDWSYALADTEMDSLETKIDFGDKHDIEVFWSMRMNDCHDAAYEENELDPWKMEHPDWLFAGKDDAIMTLRYGTQCWSAVDYGVPEVRQKVYNIIKDTVTRYDVDGIQLDFSRYPVFFKQVAISGEVRPEEVEQMNNLIRSIRTMMDQVSIERGKPLMLAVYVKDSLDFCAALGLDVRQWMEEDLIDMAAIRTTVAIQPWEDSVEEYSSYDVQLHATFDTYLAKEDNDAPDWNKEAALAYQAGVDGIQLYNNFSPNGALFDTLGSAETCGPVDPEYKSLMRRRPRYGMNVKNPERFMKDIPYSAY